ENQCEGHCVLGKNGGSPVQINAIERYISDYYLNIYKPKPSKKTRGKIAIIGSGPAGITIAFILSKKHYDVTIFEGNDQIGGVLRYGIPEFRLPKIILDRLMDVLIRSGVKIRPNTAIGTNLTVDDLFRDGYRAIFMGTGVWRPQRLNIKGESFGHVHYAIEYLRNPGVYRLGKRLAVIGAGNVAMDVARTAFRHGCEEVYILCNMDESTITARDIEVAYAKIDGAKLMFHKAAVEFVDGGLILADTEVSQDEFGNKIPVPIEGTESLFSADSVIIAIGQGPRAVIVSSTTGINVMENGLVAVDDSGRTSREGVFASGDVVTGAKTVVEAVKVSRRVADAMDQYVKRRYALVSAEPAVKQAAGSVSGS
ncbi:MAG: FAD-dependent oxidoreductase, partial [Christensenellales bacterium]